MSEVDGYIMSKVLPVKKGNSFDLGLVLKSNSKTAVYSASDKSKKYTKVNFKDHP